MLKFGVAVVISALLMLCMALCCGCSREDASQDLFMAAAKGNLKRVQDLLDRGVDANAKNQGEFTALWYAATHSEKNGEHIEVAKLLLEKGADPNTKDNDGRTALMMASINGRIDFVRLLLDKGADPSLQGAAKHLELVRLLLDKGANINAKDRWSEGTALMHAVHFNQIDVVKLLLDKGADVNANDKFDDTALKEAQKKGYTQIVELLKAHGAKE